MEPSFALFLFALAALLAAVLFWPDRGVVERLQAMTRSSERVELEDAIKHVHGYHLQGYACTVHSLAGKLEVSPGKAARLLTRLTDLGLIHSEGAEFVLTESGRRSALRLVRSHRLWEQYLADRTGVPAGEWHLRADRMEHALSQDETEALASRLGHPTYDPHGDPIPTADGVLPPPIGLSLLGVDAGQKVEIIHLEDEPREVYQDLENKGLTLHRRLEVVERSDTTIKVRVGDGVITIDPVGARNVTVRVLLPKEKLDLAPETLADVQPWETAKVIGISSGLQGAQRRRLLDLGIVPGTEITPELVSRAGDPVAYRIRGALVALRRSQASKISVKRQAPSVGS